MHRLPNKTLDSQYLHCSKLNEKIDNVIVNFGYFVYLKKLNCGEQLWSPCTKLVQSLHAILLEAATLVLLNEIRRVETQIACRTGWVTVGPAEQLLKCGGRGGGIGWTVNIPKINCSCEHQIYMLRRQGKFVCSLFTADRTVTLINLP